MTTPADDARTAPSGPAVQPPATGDQRTLTRNAWGFGLGTFGRDMVGILVMMFLLVYLTEVVGVSDRTLAVITVVLVIMRLFDAVNDPVMGLIVDNTRSRWGKFKPWIAGGAVAWGLGTLLLFTDWGLDGAAFVVAFIGVYLLWEIAYTVNDISYYGMLPSLSRNQTERERIGVIARVCANLGTFAMVVAVVPVTAALEDATGSAQRAWWLLALIAVVIMLVFQSITLVFARQQIDADGLEQEHTPLRELVGVIARNDQLLWVSLAMIMFMTGYTVTTGLGLYYFTYIYGDDGRYPIFAAVLGVTQILALLSFPLVARRLTRRQVYRLASVSCATGFVVFFVAGSSMPVIAAAGVLIFFGQAFIQLLMMMFIADAVEYGQWKLGRRNESVTFSLQPFIYKAAAALAAGITGLTLIVSGVNRADGPDDVSAAGVLAFKAAMMGVPLLLVIGAWFVMARHYRLDEQTYERIVADLQVREDADRARLAAVDDPATTGGPA